MTMQECRDRVNAPARERPASDEPRVNLGAMCLNMLSMDKAFHESRRAKAASAAAKKKRVPAARPQPQPR